MTDEWDIDQLDLPAYLRRIGHDGDTTPTERTLTALHRAHLAAIPFENVDIVLGRGISVDLGSIQAKLVERRRGGYCYEHNLLFAAVLERLGYRVDRLLARVGGDAERPRARTHMTIRVHVDGRSFLADVGFGSGVLEPLPFSASGPRPQGAWAFELAEIDGGAWELRELDGAQRWPLYRFDDTRQHAADFVMANHFTSTWPRSPFVGQIVAVRRDDDAVLRLVGRRFSVTRPGAPPEERELSDGEVADALRDVFRVPLSGEEIAQLTAATAAPDRAATTSVRSPAT